jgi:hypothetical protein
MADEVKQPETYEEINAAIDAAVGGKPESEPEPQMLEFKTVTGQVYKGRTEREVIDQLVKAQEHASMTIHQMREERRLADAQMASQRAAQQVPASIESGDLVDKPKFYKMLEEAPGQGIRYAVMQIPEIKEAFQALQQLKQGQELTTFLNNCSDFPATDQSAISAMRDRLQQEGRAPTADNLELVYARLSREGVIKPVPKAPAQEPRHAPAPVLGGMSSGQSPDPFAELERMSSADMEKLYRRKGLIQ